MCSLPEFDVVRQIQTMSGVDWRTDPTWPGYAKLERGGVCGYAEISGVLYPEGHLLGSATTSSLRAALSEADKLLRWKMPEQFGFVLANVRRFPLIPCAGRQRWFYLPPDVERTARVALMRSKGAR